MPRTSPKLLLFILFFLVNFNLLSQQKIRNINVNQEQKVFDVNNLLKNISLKRNQEFNEQILTEAVVKLKRIFHSECYYDVNFQIDTISVDSLNIDININIFPGKKYLMDKISISGNTFFSVGEISKVMQTKIGDCLNKNLLEADIEKIIFLYEKNGFPWITVKINSIELIDSNKTIYLELEIDEKGRAKIEQFKIEGNKETNPSVIIRELRIKKGEFYDNEKVNKIPFRLNKMQLFNTVEDPVLYVLNDNFPNDENPDLKENYLSAGLLIKLVEANSNYFDGLIGYLPGSLNEKGYFVGTAEVSMRNLFGTARKLNFKWSKDERFSQEIGVKYTEPWFLNYPVNLKGYFFQRKQDTLCIRRYGELKSEFMVSDIFSAGALISQENIINTSTQFLSQIPNSGTFSIGFELAYDTRDNPYNPTEGLFYRNDYFYGNKKIYSLSQSFPVQKYSIDLEIYKQTFPRQVGMFGLHGKEKKSSRIEVSDMFRFGGTNTLRGYRENQFLGSRIFWSNTEYRFLLGRRSFFNIFFDLGYYYRKVTEILNVAEEFKYGYGIGLKVETAIGIVGISLALGKGDNLTQTKIHIGLINEF